MKLDSEAPLPKDDTAEQRLLTALMLDGKCFEDVKDLEVKDFYSKANQYIYSAILKRAETSYNFEPTLIKAILEKNGVLNKIGGFGYLAQLIQGGGSPSSAGDYASIIRECSHRRQLVELGKKISSMGLAPDGKETKELYTKAQSLIYDATLDVGSDDDSPRSMTGVSMDLLARIRENIAQGNDKMRGIPSGFKELDELTLGLQGGTLNIIAARPGVGKTSFAMNIIENIALNPAITKPALVFSMEMPAEAIAMRMLATFGEVSLQKLSTGHVENACWERMISKIYALARIETTSEGSQQVYPKLYIDDTGDLSPAEMRQKAHQIADKSGGLSVIMVDYIQLMRGNGGRSNRALELGEISRSLKLMSKEFDCPVLCLSQLNRDVESRKEHRPMNSDLRESGSIEQDADLIMFLHRESLYHEKSDSFENRSQDREATLIISKNRNGALKDIDLKFVGEYTAFYNKEEPTAWGMTQEL